MVPHEHEEEKHHDDDDDDDDDDHWKILVSWVIKKMPKKAREKLLYMKKYDL